MLKFYVKVFRTSLFPNPVVYLFHVWYDDRCWSKILCSMIPNPVPDFKVKVTDIEFLYWSLCLVFTMSVFVKPLMDWFMFGMVIETGPKFYMVPLPTQKVTDSEFLYKSFVINVLQSLQWILFSCGVTIEPCLNFYAVPSQSQFMTLKSRSQTLNFLVLNLYSVSWQLLQSLWLIWIVFSMKGYKILKCSRKEKSISGELPCPATGRIDKLKGFLTKQFQMTASSK